VRGVIGRGGEGDFDPPPKKKLGPTFI